MYKLATAIVITAENCEFDAFSNLLWATNLKAAGIDHKLCADYGETILIDSTITNSSAAFRKDKCTERNENRSGWWFVVTDKLIKCEI